MRSLQLNTIYASNVVVPMQQDTTRMEKVLRMLFSAPKGRLSARQRRFFYFIFEPS